MKRITIQGIAGCFHETAAHGSFPGEEVEVLPCVSFDEQFARMAADAELLGGGGHRKHHCRKPAA